MATSMAIKVYLPQHILQQILMPLHRNQMRQLPLLARKNRPHDHLIDVSYFLEKHQKFHKRDSDRFLGGKQVGVDGSSTTFGGDTLGHRNG
jgi:hypothetical protein